MRTVSVHVILMIILLAGACESSAQLPPNPDRFYSGIWADDARTLSSICSESDTTVDLYFWAWVPQEGLNYITLRLVYPPELFVGSRPVFGDGFNELVVVDYGSGGIEWTLLFGGCPSAWVLLFRQSVSVPAAEEVSVSITEGPSLARDCGFILRDMNFLGGVSINGPSCGAVSTGSTSWGAIKRLLE